MIQSNLQPSQRWKLSYATSLPAPRSALPAKNPPLVPSRHLESRNVYLGDSWYEGYLQQWMLLNRWTGFSANRHTGPSIRELVGTGTNKVNFLMRLVVQYRVATFGLPSNKLLRRVFRNTDVCVKLVSMGRKKKLWFWIWCDECSNSYLRIGLPLKRFWILNGWLNGVCLTWSGACI